MPRRLVEELGVPELATLACRELGGFVYRADFGTGVVEYEYDHVFLGWWDGEPSPDPTECSEWYSSTMLFYLYAAKRLEGKGENI